MNLYSTTRVTLASTRYIYRRGSLSLLFRSHLPPPATFASTLSPTRRIPPTNSLHTFSTSHSPAHAAAMNSATSSFTPDSSGATPKQMSTIPNLKLNDGNEIPLLAYGVGSAQAGGADDHIANLTVMAVKNGYTHLDGAEIYGNETGLGKGIKDSGVPREKLFVTTKLTFKGQGGEEKKDLQAAFDASLEKLGLDYVDLYLVHHPDCAQVYYCGEPENDNNNNLSAIWRKMEAIQASGKAKSIGVSNFLKKDLEEVLAHAKIIPAINQIEYHPYLQHAVDDILPFCREKGIALASYSPLTPIVRAPGGPVDGVLDKLAGKYGVNPSDILLRWLVDQSIVAVTTSTKEERMQGFRNRVTSFKLTPREVEEICELGNQKHHRVFWTDKFAEDDKR